MQNQYFQPYYIVYALGSLVDAFLYQDVELLYLGSKIVVAGL